MNDCLIVLAFHWRVSRRQITISRNKPMKMRGATHGRERLAEGRGFEPPVGLPLRLISSQVPLTTQPPFRPMQRKYCARISGCGKLIRNRGAVQNSFKLPGVIVPQAAEAEVQDILDDMDA